jgi:hypothetical protein
MAVRIRVVFNDGNPDEEYVADEVIVSDGMLLVRGDGSYAGRGFVSGIPLTSIHKYEAKKN